MSWQGLKESYQARRAQWLENWQERKEDVSEGGWYFKLIVVLLVVAIPVSLIFGFLWSAKPPMFSVAVRTQAYATEHQLKIVVGTHTSVILHEVMATLLEKPGGFISNDLLPPGVFMDNMPNWEYGALMQARDLAKALREAFSRSQSQSPEVLDLAKAESRFNFDHRSWAVPASESEYRGGMTFLANYIAELSNEGRRDVQFYARADNLRYWLSTVQTRMGSLSQRLSASVGQRRINTDFAGEPSLSSATPVPAEEYIKTPWNQIDDVFYEARGATWALVHFLKAADQDFAEVLERKNARVSLRQIIRELEATQQTVYSPMILNGSGFGLWANHSLVMASYISRANAALIDLRDLLEKG